MKFVGADGFVSECQLFIMRSSGGHHCLFYLKRQKIAYFVVPTTLHTFQITFQIVVSRYDIDHK